jgi:CHAP domain
MRTLRLVSPEMRGKDVQELQKVLNDRLAHYRSRKRIELNGIYDRETSHAVAIVAYSMGLQNYDGISSVLRLILHSSLRTPQERRRELERYQHAKDAKNREDTSGKQGLSSIVMHAEHYIGVHESPPGSNWGEPYPARWEQNFGYESGVSWCGCFAGNMVIAAGGHVDHRCGFCPYIESDARSRTNGFDLWTNHINGVEPGWLVLYNWTGGSEPEHVGIVKKILSTHLVAIEGNTSGVNPSDGGMVAVMDRPYQFVVGYARPRL